jgi:hypothetical protein
MNGQVRYAVTNYLYPANNINPFYFYYPDGFTKKDSVVKLINNGLSFITIRGMAASQDGCISSSKLPTSKIEE